ncbi:hypothetical protein BWR19_10120 [Halomonas sp. 1513]|nr:hypothetical protein BWR19_10120 [Halomonas sp. 1513]
MLERGFSGSSFVKKLLYILMVFLYQPYLFFFVLKLNGKVVVLRSTLSGLVYFAAYFIPGKKVVLDIDLELPASPLVNLARKVSLKRSSLIVTQYSSVLEEKLSKEQIKGIRRKVVNITPGIETSSNAPSTTSSQSCNYARIGFLHVGKVHPRKNQLFAVRVMAEIAKQNPELDFLLSMVGGVDDSSYHEKLICEIESLGLAGRVEFLGWRDDINALMKASHALIVTSLNEGVPNAVQEAMVTGLPVIASCAGGVPDIIEHERTGLLMPNFDESGWASRLVSFLSDASQVMEIKIAAREYAKEHFSLEAYGAKYMEVLRRI